MELFLRETTTKQKLIFFYLFIIKEQPVRFLTDNAKIFLTEPFNKYLEQNASVGKYSYQSTNPYRCFHAIWYKSFDLKFEVPAQGETTFSLSAGLLLGPSWVFGHTVGPDLDFNSPHKVHAYNLVMWHTMIIQAIKHYS